MELSLSSWIQLYSPNFSSLSRAIASSKRVKSHSFEKEVVQSFCSTTSHENRFKLSRFSHRQDFSSQLDAQSLISWFFELPLHWKQCEIYFADSSVHHLRFLDADGKKVACKIRTEASTLSPNVLPLHNRVKDVPFHDGIFFEPYYKLGLQSQDGKVKAAMRHKFHQVNSFLLLMKPTIEAWIKQKSEEASTLHIFDMGCGKGYLTFAMAEYFSKLFPGRITVTGIDSRSDVIQEAQKVLSSTNTQGLRFCVSSIGKGDYSSLRKEGEKTAIVALHACNTATDVALIQAHTMKSDLFFIAPCCHNEVSRLLEKSYLTFLTRHPILQQRLASILTDGMRASVMEACGWSVEAIEFIDPEHTPKNTLLRGTYTAREKKLSQDVLAFLEAMREPPLLVRTLLSSN